MSVSDIPRWPEAFRELIDRTAKAWFPSDEADITRYLNMVEQAGHSYAFFGFHIDKEIEKSS